jgi:hypothetical protein
MLATGEFSQSRNATLAGWSPSASDVDRVADSVRRSSWLHPRDGAIWIQRQWPGNRRMTRTTSSPFAIQVLEPALPSWVPSPGEVASVSTENASSVDPDPGNTAVYWGNAGFDSIWSAYNGGAYAPTLGSLGSMLLFGGGHFAYEGNCVVQYDIAARTWALLTEPTLTGTVHTIGDPGRASSDSDSVNDRVGSAGQFIKDGTGADIPGTDVTGEATTNWLPYPIHTNCGITFLPPEAGGGTLGSLVALSVPITAREIASPRGAFVEVAVLAGIPRAQFEARAVGRATASTMARSTRRCAYSSRSRIDRALPGRIEDHVPPREGGNGHAALVSLEGGSMARGRARDSPPVVDHDRHRRAARRRGGGILARTGGRRADPRDARRGDDLARRPRRVPVRARIARRAPPAGADAGARMTSVARKGARSSAAVCSAALALFASAVFPAVAAARAAPRRETRYVRPATTEISAWLGVGGGMRLAAPDLEEGIFDLAVETTATFAASDEVRLGAWLELRTDTFRSFDPALGTELLVMVLPDRIGDVLYRYYLKVDLGAGITLRELDETPGLDHSPFVVGRVAFGVRAPVLIGGLYPIRCGDDDDDARESDIEQVDAGHPYEALPTWEGSPTTCRPDAGLASGIGVYATVRRSVVDQDFWDVTVGIEVEPIGAGWVLSVL